MTEIRYIKGDRGPMGPQGPEGPMGPQGPMGYTGEPGKCDCAETKMGPQGYTGEQGPRGYTGDEGPQGEKGEKGEKGDKGDRGPMGPQGPEGPQGEPGKDGNANMDEVTRVVAASSVLHEQKFDHSLLHDPKTLGTKEVDESNAAPGKVLMLNKDEKLVYANLPRPRNSSNPFEGGIGLGYRLPSQAGKNGYYLTTNGTVESWAAISGSGITRTIASVSVDTTAGATAATDYVYFVSGTTTLTLPTAVGNTNRYTIKNVGVATVTVAFTGGQTGDGSATLSLPVANTSIDLISNNSNWYVV